MMLRPSGLAAVARDGSRKQPLVSAAVQLPGSNGALMNTFAFAELIDCEKSPFRSSAVGIVTNRGSCGVIWCGFSYEKKKYAFSFSQKLPPSPNFGNGSGPLKLPPG